MTEEDLREFVSATLAGVFVGRLDANRSAQRMARRLGFALGDEWAAPRTYLDAARVTDRGAFIRWDPEHRCYRIHYAAVMQAEIRKLSVDCTLSF